LGCTQDSNQVADNSPPHAPIVRVLIQQSAASVTLGGAFSGMSVGENSTIAERSFSQTSKNGEELSLRDGVWKLGGLPAGSGIITIKEPPSGVISVNGQSFRGQFKIVPVSSNAFDVVNILPLESYLKGVVPREVLKGWNDETCKAQAVVARTYAIYELKTVNKTASYDLFSDQRDQVYGGMSAETAQCNAAVDATSGIVVASGPPGQEKIFKAYFSSCCGGLGQSAADAFGDPPTEPLIEKNNGTLCSQSPHFAWAPVIVSKVELTRRFKKFIQTRDLPQKAIQNIVRIDVAARNSIGRPVKFQVTDSANKRYIFTGEELRWAVNTDAPDKAKLLSSLVDIDNGKDSIRFFNGHGLGHGVGLCQWCSEARARMGLKYDQIVLQAYNNVKLIQAY